VTASPEVRTTDGWRPLTSKRSLGVRETDTILLRGLPPNGQLRIGFTEVTADAVGTASLRPATDEHLNGHVGIVAVDVDGFGAGEIELVPHKMSEGAYRILRADLQRIWTDLVFADERLTSVEAGPPPARELWRRIDRPIMQILDQPSTRVEVGVEARRLERVKRLHELTPAVVRAGLQGRSALTRTLRWTTDTPENELCTATLHLLRNHARRDPASVDLVGTIDKVLRHPALPSHHRPLRRITWGMRSDRRYRQVLAVHQVLNRPELEATEGPGELRLGVPALSRLYEYWVFLQVLVAATARYGPPEGAGFDQLATPIRGRRKRLELARGTTVTFPGPVHVAFEPNIDTRGREWMGIEYVPHPDPSLRQFGATPDVSVLDLTPGRAPSMTIFDAKYVGRSFVEQDAARMHAKYSRMQLRGVSVVHNILVAHPHVGFARQWAGYGHFGLAPTGRANPIPLPPPRNPAAPSRATPPTVPEAHEPPASPAGQSTASLAPTTPPARDGTADVTGRIHVLADQRWMRSAIGSRRIDLARLKDLVASGREVERFDLVMPQIEQLVPFGRAAEATGWTIEWIDSIDREPQIAELVGLVRARHPNPVIVVSGDPEVLRQLPPGTETFDDIDRVPEL
jgi:hypothetical protein